MSPKGNRHGNAAAKKTPPPRFDNRHGNATAKKTPSPPTTLKRLLDSPVQNTTLIPKKMLTTKSSTGKPSHSQLRFRHVHHQHTSYQSNNSNINEEATPATLKIPSIILLGTDWRKVAGKLVTTVPVDSIQAKAFGTDSVRIQCSDVQLFRIV